MRVIPLIILFSIFAFAHGNTDLDKYYALEEEIEKLESEIIEIDRKVEKVKKIIELSPEAYKKYLLKLANQKDEIKTKIESSFKYKSSLQIILELQALKYRLKVLDQTPISGSQCSPSELHQPSIDSVFDAWININHDDLDRKAIYYAQQNNYLKECIRLNEKESKIIGYQSRHICKENPPPPLFYSSPVSYKSYIKSGVMYIDTLLCFSYKGEEKDEKDAFSIVRETIPCVQNFFARHGIKLNIAMKKFPNPDCQSRINLHRFHPRNNALNWSTHQNQGSVNFNRNCSLYAHETLHSLGVRDTYPDPDCPDRKLGELDDIMRDNNLSINELNLYPYAIETMIKPLCEE